MFKILIPGENHAADDSKSSSGDFRCTSDHSGRFRLVVRRNDKVANFTALRMEFIDFL